MIASQVLEPDEGIMAHIMAGYLEEGHRRTGSKFTDSELLDRGASIPSRIPVAPTATRRSSFSNSMEKVRLRLFGSHDGLTLAHILPICPY